MWPEGRNYPVNVPLLKTCYKTGKLPFPHLYNEGAGPDQRRHYLFLFGLWNFKSIKNTQKNNQTLPTTWNINAIILWYLFLGFSKCYIYIYTKDIEGNVHFAIQNIQMNKRFPLPNQAILKQLWLVAFPSILDILIYIYKYPRQWQPTPVFLPGESQGRGSPVGCHLWGRTESDITEVT